MSNVNRVSHLPALVAKRRRLERELRGVERSIALEEGKQQLIAIVEGDRINSARTDIPSLTEVIELDQLFRAEYHRQHAARNRAILATTDEAEFTGNVKEVLEHVEGELAAAEAQVTMDVEEASRVRAEGWDAAFSLVGLREPRISTLRSPYNELVGNHKTWWAGVYQRLGIL